PEQVPTVFAHERLDFYQPFRSLQHVDFVQDDNDFFPPGTDALHEGALALGEGTINGGDEQDQVAARDELFGEPLVFAFDGVCARRIDDADILQEVGRVVLFEQAAFALTLRAFLTVAHDDDLRCCRNHALFQHMFMQERVDAGRLARVELSHNHKEEHLIERICHLPHHCDIRICALKTEEARLQFAGYLPLLSEELALLFLQNYSRHSLSAAFYYTCV